MTFPVPIFTNETYAGNAGVGYGTTGHPIDLPAVSAGDGLIIALTVRFSSGSGARFDTVTNWPKMYDAGGLTNGTAFYHECDGTEGASITIPTAGGTGGQWLAFIIRVPAAEKPDWDTTPPTGSGTPFTADTDPWTQSGTLSASTAGDNVYVAIAHQHTIGEVVSSYPSNFTDNQQRVTSSGSGSACAANLATRNLNSSSISGVSYDFSNGATGCLGVICIPPVPSGGGTTYDNSIDVDVAFDDAVASAVEYGATITVAFVNDAEVTAAVEYGASVDVDFIVDAEKSAQTEMSAGIDVDVAVASEATAAVEYGASISESIEFDAVQSGQLDMGASFDTGIAVDVSDAVQMDMGASITIAVDLLSDPTSLDVVDGTIGEGFAMGVSFASSMEYGARIDVDVAFDDVVQAATEYGAGIAVGLVFDDAASGLLDMSASITTATSFGTLFIATGGDAPVTPASRIFIVPRDERIFIVDINGS